MDHFKKDFITFMGNIRLFFITNFVFYVQNFAFKKEKKTKKKKNLLCFQIYFKKSLKINKNKYQ